MPEIIVKLHKTNGKVEIEGHYFSGGACQEHINRLLKEFGQKEDSKLKREAATVEQNQFNRMSR